MQTIINNAIVQINKGAEWILTRAKVDKVKSYKVLVNQRRTLKKIYSTCNSKATVVLYGQSQCGKSHLVNILLSADGQPLMISDRLNDIQYDFLHRFNPPGGGESTGIITRFTMSEQPGATKKFPLHVKLMTVKDIVLMLCDGYYNDLGYRQPFDADKVKQLLATLSGKKTNRRQNYITEDDIRDIEEYHQSFFSKDMYHVLSSDSTDYFGELSMIIEHLDEQDILLALNMFWNNDEKLSQKFHTLFSASRQIGFSNEAFISFDDIDRTKGDTLLNIGWLDMKDTATKSEVMYHNSNGDEMTVSIPKADLASICSEIVLEVSKQDSSFESDNEIIEEKRKLVNAILTHIDILDFPGARARKKLDSTAGNVGEILRRGKVGYYFNKYSSERKLLSLLFCWDPRNFEVQSMNKILRYWIDISIGREKEDRSVYMQNMEIPPLFLVGTKYNDVLFTPAGETEGIDLNGRWDKWFIEQLSQNIIGVPQNKDEAPTGFYTWFESWTTEQNDFKNIYMLRDFQYSSRIFEGWEQTGVESSQKRYPYPGFYEKLKSSFLSHPFVKNHVNDAENIWDNSSEANCDGSLPIARNLAKIVPRLATAAKEKNRRDAVEAMSIVIKELVDKHYYKKDTEEDLKKALVSAARLQASLDIAFGRDPYYFGHFMKNLTITEYKIHEVLTNVFSNITSASNIGEFVHIYTHAPGLKPSNTFDENVGILRSTYGFSNDEDCKSYFEDNLKIDLHELFKCSEFGLQSPSQILAAAISDYWFDDWLGKAKRNDLCRMLGEGSYEELVGMMHALYVKYEVERNIAKTIHNYVDTFGVNMKDLMEMIADICAEKINSFVLSVGYDYYSNEEGVVDNLKVAEKKHSMGLNFDYVDDRKKTDVGRHIASLMTRMEDTENIRQMLTHPNEYSVDELSSVIPGFRQSCRWRDLAKMGFVLTNDIPQYDVEANDLLGRIIESCRTIKF